MKRMMYYGALCLALCAALLAGCDKEKIEEEKPEVKLALSKKDLIFDHNGGKNDFAISCNGDWTLESTGDWCKTDFSFGTLNQTVTVTVDPYDGTEDRNANLTIKAGDKTEVLTVTQKGKDAIILSKDKHEVPQKGGTVSIEVKSNIAYTVTIPAEYQSWIKQAQGTRAMASKTYDFTVAANDSTDKRDGYIVFSGNSLKDTVRIYQAPKSVLVLAQREYSFPAKDTSVTVELRTNINYEVTILGDASSWISRAETRTMRTDRLRFQIRKNTGESRRTAKIAVREKDGELTDTVTITQTLIGSGRDVTADFDKAFAGLLCRKGYIPDSTRILTGDVQNIDSLNVGGTYEDWQAGKGLTSLKGLEHFESLTKLYCYYNQLDTLDVSKNTALTQLSCSGNQLTSLDVSKNTALTYLACRRNQLTSLDVSKNTALTSLDCNENQLPTLDVSKNTALKSLYCYENQLTSLDVSKNTALTQLVCSKNQLPTLDVSKNTALKSLYCYENQLTSLDVSKNTALTSLDCRDNPGNGEGIFMIEVWNGYGNTLTYLTTSWEYGGKRIFARVWNKEGIKDSDKDITADFDPAFAKVLQEKGYIPDASRILVRDVKFITILNLYSKGLTSLKGLEYFESLASLSCWYNQLTSLDVSKNTRLTGLSCYNNQLTSLDVSGCATLTKLYCHDNKLASLDVSKNTALTSLDCYNNQLTSLDVSQNTALTQLVCNENQLPSARTQRQRRDSL